MKKASCLVMIVSFSVVVIFVIGKFLQEPTIKTETYELQKINGNKYYLSNSVTDVTVKYQDEVTTIENIDNIKIYKNVDCMPKIEITTKGYSKFIRLMSGGDDVFVRIYIPKQ